jgi:CRP-like cAMP-binding protein
MDDQLEFSVFSQGTVIFNQGDAAESAYLIKSGTVDIVVVRDGIENVVDQVGPGDVFGEMALVDNNPRSATARAADDTICAVFSKDDINQKLAGADLFSVGLIRLLIKRLRETTGRIGE